MSQEPWRPKRAHLAGGCVAKTGETGTFLFASERPGDADPVSPVFKNPGALDQLIAWAKANDWHPMGVSGCCDWCHSSSIHFKPEFRKYPKP